VAKSGVVVVNKVTGAFSIDLTGYHGKGCSVDARAFTVGSTVTKDIHKKEWDQVQTEQKGQSQCS
jgi:hypothetical protein